MKEPLTVEEIEEILKSESTYNFIFRGPRVDEIHHQAAAFRKVWDEIMGMDSLAVGTGESKSDMLQIIQTILREAQEKSK